MDAVGDPDLRVCLGHPAVALLPVHAGTADPRVLAYRVVVLVVGQILVCLVEVPDLPAFLAPPLVAVLPDDIVAPAVALPPVHAGTAALWVLAYRFAVHVAG